MAYCGPSSYTSENWGPKQREQSLSTGPDSIVILLVQCAVLIKTWWSAQGTELNTVQLRMHFLHLRHLSPSLTSTVADLTWHEEISYHSQRLAWLGMKRFPTAVRGWHEEISYHSQRLAWLGMKRFPTAVRGWHEEISYHSQRLAWLGMKRFPTTVRGWPDLAWRDFLPQSEVGWRDFLPQSEAGLTWPEEISDHSQKVGSSAGRVQPDPGYWLDIDLGKLHYICQWKRKQILWLQIVLLQSMRLETVWTVRIQTCRQHSSRHHGYISIYMYPKLIHLDILTGDQSVRVTEVPLSVTGN